ncbi:MAG TPA: tRNA (adenosine(37)-N6)-threonylcarbamoyltransferase complex ATPase subunit type 1 TsaE [Candidatus Paceibacterota bacterium]|nr:tRNA (adenosine(37)-N6)-threonylcarbamoyltransferase complex ATPase subunit type 1 TsaE [Candidatus Paceibacterota bacterium]
MQKITLAELPAFAQQILGSLSPKQDAAVVIALSGDLGAGKTTFTQALAKAIGVEETVQSPTYVLMKSYPIIYKGFEKLVHIDAYRLDDPKEFATLKPETFLNDPKALVCIEWPEKVRGMLSKPDMLITFSSDNAGEGERGVTIENPRD